MGVPSHIGLGFPIQLTLEHSRVANGVRPAYWASYGWERLKSNRFALDVSDGILPTGNRTRLEEFIDSSPCQGNLLREAPCAVSCSKRRRTTVARVKATCYGRQGNL
ncbi:MAG: hypothetical protein D6690_09480 [Nitrospirae bacterium]|nr:MAG: hypothetical protein D6690_09480 [Nitrospirota bacterium]